MAKTRLTEGRLVLLDAASARHYDENGYLHVSGNALTRDQVAPYYGAELPEHEGIEPDRIYYAYRPREELKKALDTYNGVPLLIEHEFDSADNPLKELRVGAIGTEAAWDDPYLRNSLTVWDADAIRKIEDGSLRELSCGYTFRPEWVPGKTADGVAYDLVMRDIKCNHVALVQRGRATGCRVADESLPISTSEEHPDMDKTDEKKVASDDFTEWSRKVIESAGIELSAENIDKLVHAFAEAHAEFEKREAEQAHEDVEGTREDEDKPADDEDEGKEPETEDEDGDKKDAEDCDGKAGDADIIAKAVDAARAQIVAQFTAADEVRGVIGAIKTMSFDSATAIYQHALAQMGHKGVSDAAAREVFLALAAAKPAVKPAAKPAAESNPALDAALARIQ